MKYAQKDIERIGYLAFDAIGRLQEDEYLIMSTNNVEYCDENGQHYSIKIKVEKIDNNG